MANGDVENVEQKESVLFRIGIRAIITLILVIFVCVVEGYRLYILAQEPGEELKLSPYVEAAFTFAIGFYFGQKSSGTKT